LAIGPVAVEVQYAHGIQPTHLQLTSLLLRFPQSAAGHQQTFTPLTPRIAGLAEVEEV
jgi:hypothetical protein